MAATGARASVLLLVVMGPAQARTGAAFTTVVSSYVGSQIRQYIMLHTAVD